MLFSSFWKHKPCLSKIVHSYAIASHKTVQKILENNVRYILCLDFFGTGKSFWLSPGDKKKICWNIKVILQSHRVVFNGTKCYLSLSRPLWRWWMSLWVKRLKQTDPPAPPRSRSRPSKFCGLQESVIL